MQLDNLAWTWTSVSSCFQLPITMLEGNDTLIHVQIGTYVVGTYSYLPILISEKYLTPLEIYTNLTLDVPMNIS